MNPIPADTVIVDSDTLRATGLRSLLEERHALDAVIATDPTAIDGVTDATIFFVTPEAFAARPMYYVPRRERVALISHIDSSPLPVVNPMLPEARLAERLDAIVRSMRRPSAQPSQAPLSERERNVLRLIAMGHTNKETAARLGISFNTVLTHRRNIMDKLDLRTVPALSMYAVMNGLVTQTEIQP